ncbi:MAG: ribonuclease J [Mycoplasmataceae bacterium]|jgi:ribonuclease J|nr:ribonuclease J [Mycoplasmataceae bacterium]
MENITTNQIPTYIYALGGIEEIGKNMYVIEHDDEIYIIDCGIKFADENILLGVNAIICPFDYLVENKNKIKGLIVTHAHEDHIGGIPYLLKTLSIPKIHAAKLTAGIISKKLKEHKDLLPFHFEHFSDDTKITSKHFKIEFFRVCHSIPDAFGVYVETINGKIVSTGDFRFDFCTQGDESDILKMADLGRREIDVLLCESTNADTPGFSMSEKFIIDELRRLILKAKGRVILSTFASNLGRIEEVIEIAVKAGRKICLCGRSMETNIETSINVGFLNVDNSCFIESRDVDQYKDNEIIILSTGSQGEEMAALSQMANGKHSWITLKPTDTLILSSNPIPGNYAAVENLVNKFYRTGMVIVQNTSMRKIHASGHATKQEHQLMFKLINPQYIVPIHGEFKMLKALRISAVESGINSANVIQVVNGQKIQLLNHVATATEEFIDAGEVYVDGNKINSDSTGVLKYRRVLSQDGIFNVTMLIDRENKRITELPVIATRGSFYAKTSTPLITKIAYSIKENVENAMKRREHIINNNEIRRITENTTEFFIWKNKKKKPLVRTTVFDV